MSTVVTTGAAEASPQPGEEGEQGSAAPAREPSRRVAVVLLALLAAQFTALALHQAWNDAPTFDEMTYMSTGLAGLYDGELRQNPEAPFLPKAVHALPLRVAGVDVPLDGSWEDSATIDFRDPNAVFYNGVRLNDEFTGLHTERGDLQRVVFLGRLMGVAEGVLIGLALYALSATLFSRTAGLLAAGAWLTTPLAVGFGHLNSLDLAFTLAVVAAALALVRHLRAPTWRTLSVLALAAGALQLARHTGFMYVALVCVVLVVRRWRDRRAAARDVGVVLVATWALVWVAALIVAPTRVPVEGGEVDDLFGPAGVQRGFVADVLSSAVDAVPWPVEYKVGFQMQLAISGGDTPGYLLGDTWQGARPAFWPLAMLVKLPITVVAVAVLGPFAWRTVSRDQRRLALLVAVLPTLAAFAFVLPYTKPVGVRYALPGIAMLLVVASPLALALLRRRAGAVVLGLGVVAQLAFLWTSVPHSLAWTAPPFRPGYRVVSESNLDWGQDGYRLAAWMDGRQAHVAYFGAAHVVDDLPGYRPLLGTPPEEITGWVAVSASFLTTYYRDQLAYLRAYCNVGTLGGTVLLYRFDEPPTQAAGPDAPAGRCDGSFSRRV